jgi:hypothetical protein
MPLGRPFSPAPRLSLGASEAVGPTFRLGSYDLQMGKPRILAATHPGRLAYPLCNPPLEKLESEVMPLKA